MVKLKGLYFAKSLTAAPLCEILNQPLWRFNLKVVYRNSLHKVAIKRAKKSVGVYRWLQKKDIYHFVKRDLYKLGSSHASAIQFGIGQNDFLGNMLIYSFSKFKVKTNFFQTQNVFWEWGVCTLHSTSLNGPFSIY